MPYPGPLPAFDELVLSEALDIAMNYLEGTGQGDPYTETQDKVADAILLAWHGGVMHKIALANCGIIAVERGQPRLRSFYSRVC